MFSWFFPYQVDSGYFLNTLNMAVLFRTPWRMLMFLVDSFLWAESPGRVGLPGGGGSVSAICRARAHTTQGFVGRWLMVWCTFLVLPLRCFFRCVPCTCRSRVSSGSVSIRAQKLGIPLPAVSWLRFPPTPTSFQRLFS